MSTEQTAHTAMAEPEPDPEPDPAPRTDPRVDRSRTAVLEATVALLVECGLADVRVEAVARRSGVAKTTIYRHWATRDELLFDALATLVHPAHDPDSGTVAEDLRLLLGGLATSLTTTPWGRILPSVLEAAERDDTIAELHRGFVGPRNRILLDVVDRGVARGELPPDTCAEDLIDLAAGAVFFRRFVTRRPLDEAYLDWVVSTVLGRPR